MLLTIPAMNAPKIRLPFRSLARTVQRIIVETMFAAINNPKISVITTFGRLPSSRILRQRAGIVKLPRIHPNRNGHIGGRSFAHLNAKTIRCVQNATAFPSASVIRTTSVYMATFSTVLPCNSSAPITIIDLSLLRALSGLSR